MASLFDDEIGSFKELLNNCSVIHVNTWEFGIYSMFYLFIQLNGACPTKVNYGNHESDIMFSIVASERLPSTLLKQILLSFVWTLSVPNTTSIINIILRHTTPYNNTYQLSLVEAGIQLHGQSESLDELLARQKAVKSITWRSNIALNNTDQVCNTSISGEVI